MAYGSPAYEAPELLTRVHRSAQDADLGAHRAVFARMRPGIEGWTVLLGLIAASAIAIMVAGISESLTDTEQPGTEVADVVGPLCVTPFVAVPSYFFLESLYRGFFGRPGLRAVRLDLYDRGLVFAEDDKLRCVRYDTTVIHRELVRHMLYGLLELQTTYRYDLIDVEGEKLSLTHSDAPEVARWGPAIEHDLAMAQLPSMAEKLHRDDHVSFDKLWLTTRGCGADRNSVLWTQVQQVAVINGQLWAHVDGRWLPLSSTSLEKIPNLCVFLALADQLIADAHRQGSAPARSPAPTAATDVRGHPVTAHHGEQKPRDHRTDDHPPARTDPPLRPHDLDRETDPTLAPRPRTTRPKDAAAGGAPQLPGPGHTVGSRGARGMLESDSVDVEAMSSSAAGGRGDGWWKRRKRGEDPTARADLAAMVEAGERHYRRGELADAELCWHRAAEAGHPAAMHGLGVIFTGRGQNFPGELWYRRAAAAGFTRSMTDLGVMLTERGADAEAESWYRKAAADGRTESMNNLATMLDNRGETAEAEHWWRTAAAAGDVGAMYQLGRILENRGRLADAESWWRTAATAGETRAMYRLAKVLESRNESEAKTASPFRDQRPDAARSDSELVEVPASEPPPDTYQDKYVLAGNIIGVAAELHVAASRDIHRDFLHVAEAWNAEEVLLLGVEDLQRLLATVLMDNALAGFSAWMMDVAPTQRPARVQFNLAAAGTTEERSFRIARQGEAVFAVYGHSSLYRAQPPHPPTTI